MNLNPSLLQRLLVRFQQTSLSQGIARPLALIAKKLPVEIIIIQNDIYMLLIRTPKLVSLLYKPIHSSTNSNKPSLRRIIRNLSQLTKFKLSVLNSIVTVSAFCMYPTPVSAVPLFMSSLVLSMSTQSLNQYIELKYDKMMVRTNQRPLVLGMNPNYALSIGIGLGMVGIYGLMLHNVKTALIGGVIWLGYLGIYTTLKRITEMNTFIGAIVGSLPVYLGWVAAGRSVCLVEPFSMFVYMMAWQHQHFYGIRWIYYDDYNNAGFRMQNSKQYAALITILQLVFAIFVINYSLKYCEFNHYYILNIILTGGLYRWGIQSMIKFDKGTIDGKTIKMDSYKHFTLYFAYIFMNFAYKWYNGQLYQGTRNKMDQQCILNYI